jgi:hypothetical protein
MIKYLLKGEREPVEVSGPTELVEYMNRTAAVKSHDPKAYMLDFAKRAVMHRNLDIRATDPEAFVEDLIKIGEVSIIQPRQTPGVYITENGDQGRQGG